MHISRVSQCFTMIPAWEARIIAIIQRPHRLNYTASLPFLEGFQRIPLSRALNGNRKKPLRIARSSLFA